MSGEPAGRLTESASGSAGPRAGLLYRLGLHRPELRAWAMYDWANSAFVTTIMTAVFPIFWLDVVEAGVPHEVGEYHYGLATTAGLVVIALLSPVLGALADCLPIKKRLLGSFLAIGLASVSLMYFIEYGDVVLASALFIISNFAVNGSFVFYDSLLPHVAREDELDRVSTAGYALGYIGGGVLLALNIAWIVKPGLIGLPSGESLTREQETLPTRLAFVSVAVWWLVFSIPLFLRVPEPPVRLEARQRGTRTAVKAAFVQLRKTLTELRGYRDAFLMLLAFLIYNDGIGTVYRMAAIYGRGLQISQDALIASIMITQFVGVPFAFLFGSLAGRIGAKRSVFLALAVYCGISVGGYFMTTATHFLILAVAVGMVQGGAQALSRSLFASMIPRNQSGQFFGFFAVVEKFAGILGPALFSLMIARTGSSRYAILSVIAFFVVGGGLLAFVNVERGQRTARAAEAGLAPEA